MLLDIFKKGSTSRSVELRIIDSTDGTPELGVVFNTSGIDLWYRREGGARVAITEATLASLTTAWSSGGFLHISDGVYRLDVPDAAFATGANQVSIGGAVTGMVVIGGRVRLVDYDPESASNLGLTNLDATVSSRATPAQVATELTTYGGLKPTVAGRTLDVTATGEAGLDYANAAGTPADPAGVGTLLTRVGTPTNLGGGSATLAGNLQDIENQTDDIGAAGAGLTALGDTRIANLDATVSSRASQTSVNALPTAAVNADAVWDEVLSGHLAGGSAGAALNGAGSAGDPWTTSLPGAYGAGTAGNILGNRLDAAVSSRATPAQVQTELGTYGGLKPTVAGRTLDVTANGEAGIDLDNTVGTLAKGTDLTGFNDLSAANVQSELTTYGALKPTVAARTLDVSATGEAGVDWANVGSPTTAQTLSGTTVGTVTTLTNDPAGVTTLLTRIPSALFSGITSLAQWLGAMAGKQTGNATARTEIRATGAGSGTFDETTDSQEAHRDNMGTPQSGDSFARIGANGASLTALGDTRIANLDATVSSRASSAALTTVQADTDDIQARLPAALVSGRIDASTGVIQTAAVDSIWAKAMTEISGIPAITASVFDAVRWVFTASRNKNTQTATTQIVRNDADSSNIASATVSDDGTTFTRGKFS